MRRNLVTSPVVFILTVALLGAVVQAQNTINTVAGGGNPTNVSPATNAPVGQPWAVIQDASGNTYVSDTHSNRVYEITSGGAISVIAGMTTDGLSGNQGTPTANIATKASLSFPQGLAFVNGALYIADDGNNQIRVVNTNPSGGASITIFAGAVSPNVPIVIPAGDIADVAGLQGGAACAVPSPLTLPACGDTGFATSAALNAAAGVFVDASGDIFIADTGDHVIREVNGSTGIITLVAGSYTACNTGTNPGCGDNGAATSAQLNSPNDVALDGSTPANIFIADTGDNVVRAVNTQATTITIDGVSIGAGQIAAVVGNYTACDVQTNPSCVAPVELTSPAGVFLDASGDIYIADTGDQVVREVVSGTISLIAGKYASGCSPNNSSSPANCGDGNPATSAWLNTPTGVFFSNGSVFISDEIVGAIREVVSSGTISTIAGLHFNYGYFGDGGPATGAEVQEPTGVAIDAAGNLYIADQSNNVIRKVDTSGNISTVAGNGIPCQQLNNLPPCGDSLPATQASLFHPSDVFVDSAGTIYIADTGDNWIRAVNTSTSLITVANVKIAAGAIQTIAGSDTNPTPGFGGDGGAAISAIFNTPVGLFVDGSGNIYVADSGNSRIREINGETGIINTVAGNGTTGYNGDGIPATSAEISNAVGVFVDVSGNIYIVDGGNPFPGAVSNNRIRKVDTTVQRIISTIAGNGTPCGVGTDCGDGAAATSAQLTNPWSTFVDFLGNLFIADQQDQAIRVVNTSMTTQTVGGVEISKGDIGTIIGTVDVAGTPQLKNPGFAGDGEAIAANLTLAHGPMGMRADSNGNLYFVDHFNWRIREVTGIVATTPTANLSPLNGLTFPSTQVGAASAAQGVTITNNANLSPLNFTISITGTNASDFSESDSCSGTVASNGKTCTLNVTFKPTAAGANLAATMTITDSVAGIAKSVALSGASTQASTTTALKSSVNPSEVDQSVTFTATVTPTTSGTPTGTVTFKDGTTVLGSAVTLNASGVATLAISTLSKGTHSITAVYSGDSNYTGSTSGAVSQVVAQATTTTALKSSANPSYVSESVTFTATVTPTSSGTATGTVTFKDGSTVLGSAVTLNASGVATLAISTLSKGTHSITAVYSGDSNFTASTSAAVSQVVSAPFTLPSTGTLSPATVTAGSSATATITVSSVNGFASAVTLSCSVSPSPAAAPTCSFNPPSPITPKANGTASSTLTVSTTGTTTSAVQHRSNVFFAVWLLLPAMLLSSTGLNTAERRKFLSCLLLLVALGGTLFLVACGGGSSTTPPPTSGTPSGPYVITVTAASGSTTVTQTLDLTVQ